MLKLKFKIMKPILIDELVNNDNNCQSEHKIMVDGVLLQGYQIAKPLNYEPEHFNYKDRIDMAIEILLGKAIAVRYFDDLTEEEKIEYVKTKKYGN